MNALLPLLAMMWFDKSKQPSGGMPPAPPAPPAPRWPTTASPPPPMPAFSAKPTAPSADPGRSSTPLADLHRKQAPLPPASATEPATLKAKAAAAAQQAKAKALNTFQQQLRTAAQAPLTPIDPWAAPTTSVPVANLQQILNGRGAKLVRDGLYGPKTAAAWTKAAKAKGLPPTIARVGPKTAKVVSRTYESLATPPIP